MQPRERRRFPRTQVDIPATLFLHASDDMRRACRIQSLSGGGVGIYVATLEPLPVDASHEIRFELPNRSEALFFECAIVDAYEDKEGKGQIVHLTFTNPRAGYQDAVINYMQNRKRFDRAAFRVAMPVSMEAQTGLRQFVPYKGTTIEAGREYAVCDLQKFQLAVTSEVVATFLGPKFRDEIFLSATVTKVDRNPATGTVKVRIEFQPASDQMLDFIRRHYGAKAKPIQGTA
ncbi:MAG: PilZ domain-containing protein [Chloroflexi bacterium]|nr:PilZ domain-containing protein [Chloroflexota bacterium]